MREIVKIRKVAGSLVVSLPQSVLEPIGLGAGDRVVVEAAPPQRLIITKEGKPFRSSERVDLELRLLRKKKAALDSDLKFKEHQWNHNMPTEPGMDDQSIAFGMMYELARDRDRIAVEIAEKELELYELVGTPTEAER